MGVVKKSLQTRHLRDESSGASAARGVGSQSVLSVTSYGSGIVQQTCEKEGGMRQSLARV